jgi:hypothetical protein
MFPIPSLNHTLGSPLLSERTFVRPREWHMAAELRFSPIGTCWQFLCSGTLAVVILKIGVPQRL